MSKKLERDVREILGRLVHTHWGRRILSAAKRGRFTKADVRDAADWPTCACGKMCARKPYKQDKTKNFRPTDSYLMVSGANFESDVKGNNILDAADALTLIEGRATQLIDLAAFRFIGER